MIDDPSSIRVGITGPDEVHCFRLVFRAQTGEEIEIMLHATQLVTLLHKGNLALAEWQHQTTNMLIERLMRSRA
jgi:hypothetical protein